MFYCLDIKTKKGLGVLMIISLIQTKGGTGKTTLATCLAYSKLFTKQFNSISLIELDQQGTIFEWFSQRQQRVKKDNINFFSLANSSNTEIEKTLINIGDKSDIIVLDIPGESTAKFRSRFATALSDIILIPMRTSANDEQSLLSNMLPFLANYKTKSFIIPSFIHPNAKTKNIQDYFENEFPYIKCLEAIFHHRGVYENFSRGGFTLHEYSESVKSNKKDYAQAQKAIQDIENIAKNILDLKT